MAFSCLNLVNAFLFRVQCIYRVYNRRSRLFLHQDRSKYVSAVCVITWRGSLAVLAVASVCCIYPPPPVVLDRWVWLDVMMNLLVDVTCTVCVIIECVVKWSMLAYVIENTHTAIKLLNLMLYDCAVV